MPRSQPFTTTVVGLTTAIHNRISKSPDIFAVPVAETAEAIQARFPWLSRPDAVRAANAYATYLSEVLQIVLYTLSDACDARDRILKARKSRKTI
jgi:hypothetical protein